MTDVDDLEAAWDAVHNNVTRGRADCPGYDAMMRVARWRCLLVLMVVLVPGCPSRPT